MTQLRSLQEKWWAGWRPLGKGPLRSPSSCRDSLGPSWQTGVRVGTEVLAKVFPEPRNTLHAFRVKRRPGPSYSTHCRIRLLPFSSVPFALLWGAHSRTKTVSQSKMEPCRTLHALSHTWGGTYRELSMISQSWLSLILFFAAHGLSFFTAWGILVPQPGMEPASPALQGRFLTTWPPRKF